MDAAKKHSRAGHASVLVREADERSEGTATRREDRRSGQRPVGSGTMVAANMRR